MHICVFGADGRTGVEVVKYATSKDYFVTAFVYSESSNKFFPKGVKIIKGDVKDEERVEEALKGCNAVISTLGHIKGSDPRMQAKGMKNILRGMYSTGIKRILSLTGTGVRVSGDRPSLIDRFLNFFVAKVDPDRVNDGIEHFEVLNSSNALWTVVRVLKLGKSDKEVSDYELTEGGPAELVTSRKKVAKILVDLVDREEWFKKLPVVSK